MGNRNHFEELIVSYLSNNLDAEEEAFIEAWINDSEENKQYFEELKSWWIALSVKRIDVDHAWSKFTFARSSNQEISEEAQTGKFNEELVKFSKHVTTRKKNLFRILISATVAATIIILYVISANLTGNHKALPPVAEDNLESVIVQRPTVEHQFNATGKIKKIVLADGSVVRLFTNSSIRYFVPFSQNKRDITLEGKATFKVAKDTIRPFQVISGDIATTALGTQFTVTAFKEQKNVTVRLYEGKIIIKPSDEVKGKLRNNYYLLPGQELIYSNKSASAKIRTFKPGSGLTAKHESAKENDLVDNPFVPKADKEQWFMFNNQSLDQIFDQLREMFHTDIVYKKKDVAKLYFIGKFNVSDSLDYILNQVSTLNKLNVSRKNNTFIINK